MLRILPRIFNARKLSLRTLNTEKPKVQKEKKEEMLAKKTPSGKLDELALQQTNPLLFKTLQVFSYGTVKDLPKEVDLPPAALSKLRQLSLISLAANSSSNRQLPYAEVMQFLELSATRELEDIVIDAIYNKLIKARLDSKGQFVEVDDWASRDTPLEAIPDIIDMFQQFSHRVADVRQSALQDADRRDAQVLADLKRAQQVEADLVAARKAHDESMLLELEMVCLPCIFLPVLLAIYLKFIQPILPQRWVEFLDPILYPTCPAKPPAPEASGSDICQFVIFGSSFVNSSFFLINKQEHSASEACSAGVNETKKEL
ncbi:unnamed protein product [Nippostrongylus brasiliensis]|uniref:COP9 signalosome complex subunit 7 (inferred by orthology to a D. melanogaster protein) n=1 Tax=Nippostrongylus brasiliensis TaxID=27835 RepID=A0A158R031_NIPBR|nr:unnamed protein product [Nippostrongylus brasiliensis]